MKSYILLPIFCLFITQIYFAQGNWRKIGDMPEKRYGHSVDEINGKIYVIGGATDEVSAYPSYSLVYDRTSGEWSNISLYNNSIRGAHMSCVVDGNLYVVGGNDGVRTVATMEMFAPDSSKWISKTNMSTDRGLAACAAINDKIYVIGGLRGTLPWNFDWAGVSTVEVYDTKNDTWTQLADMPTKRWGHCATVANGKIYVFGGRTWPEGASSIYSSVEEYDPQTNSWSTKPGNMPTKRYCLTSSLLDSKIYVIGGWYHSSDGPMYDKIEVYDFEKNEWKIENPLPAKLAVLPSTVIDGKIYVYGGARTTHPNYGTSEIYEFSNKDIFAQNSFIDKTYARKDIDSVCIRTEFFNKNNHQFTPYLILDCIDNPQKDSLALYDDGLHGDLLKNDGIYGCYIPPQSTEDFFSLSVSTFDKQTNKYYFSPDKCRFTTAGPVVLNSIEFTEKTGWLYVKPYVRNTGNQTITTAQLRIICYDPWVSTYAQNLIILPNLIPGINVGGSWRAIQRIDSLYKGYFNIKVNVWSNGWSYWMDSMKVVTTDVRRNELPESFALQQNYPNPFNPSTTIDFSLPTSQFVTLKVYDVLGNEVAALVNEEKPAGSYKVIWNSEGISSGIYFYQIMAGNFKSTKKMVLLR